MLKYFCKRVIMMFPIILGISFIIFSILNLTPGDPVTIILGDTATPEAKEALREQLGLNGGFFVRYFRYVINALHGNFGQSYRSGLPVIEELMARIPVTFRLSIVGIGIVICIGIPIGIISAIRQYSLLDNVCVAGALIIASMPVFWLGLMLIMIFSLKLNMFPATGTGTWKNYVLPAITNSAIGVATLVRMTRSSMLESMRQDYIRTAKAKGAGEAGIVIKHALKNALLPIVTIIGTNFAIMLSGAMITETVFALPGLGSLIVTGVRQKDTPVVIAAVIFIAVAISVINLIVDIIYTIIDPRLKSTLR